MASMLELLGDHDRALDSWLGEVRPAQEVKSDVILATHCTQGSRMHASVTRVLDIIRA